MSDPKRGKLVVISGPSGTGKTSICEGLLKTIPNARWSVSVTTRKRRGAEVDGVDYRFLDRAEYDRMVQANELLEHAEYLGHGYGTPRTPVDVALSRGETVIMEIDVQGGAQIASEMQDSVRIFVMPPSMPALKQRLAHRKTETPEAMEQRLAEAQREMEFAAESGCYTHFVTNEDLSAAIAEVIRIVKQESRL